MFIHYIILILCRVYLDTVYYDRRAFTIALNRKAVYNHNSIWYYTSIVTRNSIESLTNRIDWDKGISQQTT